MLAFEDVVCIQAEMEEINRVYRSDAQVRLGPGKLPCAGFTFVVKRKTGMETYLGLYARDIKRSLIYRVDPDARGVGDPSTQVRTALDLLKDLDFKLEPINLKYGAAMLEVVLQDIPALMSPAKAQKTKRERNANLMAWENQAAYLRDRNLLDADENTLSKMAREDRNRYNTAVAAYQKLEVEDHYDEQRELLFEYIDSVLHGRTPPKPGSFIQDAPVKLPVEKPAPQPVAAKTASVQKPKPSAPKKQAAEKPEGEKQKTAEPEEKREKKPATQTATKIVSDPKDKQRINELEQQLAGLQEQLSTAEDQVVELEAENSQLKGELKSSKAELKEAKADKGRLQELEVELETAHHDTDEAQKEIRRLKSDNAKQRRKIEDLEEQQSQPVQYDEEPTRPRSRLNTGRLLNSSSTSSPSSGSSSNAPHVLRKPPPAGATFGIDWDLEHMPCTSLDQVIELYQSICNAQLTLEGYSTQYCSAYIIIVSENGGRQLYMVFHLTREARFLIYKPVKKPTSNADIGRLLKEAQKFLQVCGVDTERISLGATKELPSGELKNLFAEI